MQTDTAWNGESEALLRLALVRGLGPARQRVLMDAFGSAAAFWRTGTEEVARQVDPAIARCLRAGTDERMVERVLRWRESAGHHVVAWNSVHYPALLRETAGAPLVLYAKGRVERLQAPSLAIVGSRNATSQGRRDARDIAMELSHAGLCIVSGLALGIDAAAHEGGLAGSASSVAILGTGVDSVYPRSNRALAARLERDGCIASEFELGTPPVKGNFPVRNRLISGLARGVLVIEAAVKSGSLITAKCALDQGREVFAMPGSIHSPLSKGTHSLIRQGAKLTECADDVLVELRLIEPAARRPRAQPEAYDALLDAMGFAPISLEQLATRVRANVREIAERLSILEIEGRVAPLTGGLFQRTPAAAGAH